MQADERRLPSAAQSPLSRPVTRGWTETAWAASGSGCSAYEPKPTWQTNTGCTRRTSNDVAADANPSTGVAAYDSYSQSGWFEVGGTGVASAIIAATYALAGTPAAGTYPASYLYAHSSSLFDVTTGSNGSCRPPTCAPPGPVLRYQMLVHPSVRHHARRCPLRSGRRPDQGTSGSGAEPSPGGARDTTPVPGP